MATSEEIYSALETVMDPELGLPITEMGLIYDVKVEGAKASIIMTLTTMGCPMSSTISDMARNAVLSNVKDIEEAEVEIVWDPPWSVDMMTDEARAKLGML